MIIDKLLFYLVAYTTDYYIFAYSFLDRELLNLILTFMVSEYVSVCKIIGKITAERRTNA